MFEKFPEIWNLIKGRVITDLNLLAVGLLIWMMTHESAASLPVINHLPTFLQPIAAILFPVAWGIAIQVLVKLTREDAANEAKAKALFEHLTQDAVDIIQHPDVQTVARVVRQDVIPAVAHAVEEAVPAVAPVVQEVAKVVDEVVAGQHVDLGGVIAEVAKVAEPAIATAITGIAAPQQYEVAASVTGQTVINNNGLVG